MSTTKQAGKTDPDKESQEVFNTFGKDGNGAISKVEFKHLMSNFGQNLSNEELDARCNDGGD